MTELIDARLEAVLHSVGQHLVVDDQASAHDPRNSECRTQRKHVVQHLEWRSRALLIAAAFVALTLTAVVVDPVRRTLAGWFSIGHTEITLDGTVDSGELPELQEGAVAITANEAARRLGRPLPIADDTRLGVPEAIVTPAEGGVLLVWPTGSTTLWIQPVGLAGDVLYKKLVDAGESPAPVDDLGDGALSITGDHVLRTPQRQLAADTVVLWTRDGLEFRLESDLDGDEMVHIARSLDE